MIKKYFILFIVPILLSAAEVKKEYTFSKPQIRNGEIKMQGCGILRAPFSPRILKKTVSLLLPTGEKAISYSVKYSDPVLLEGEQYIRPFMPGGRLCVEPPDDYYTRRSGVYSIDAFYPAQVRSQKFFTQFKNGHPIFTASINPVQYNPVSGKIRYYNKISVSVKTEKTRTPMYKCDPWIRSQLRLRVDNPEAVDKLVDSKKSKDDYAYLIVTSEDLQNSFDEFIAFNERRCLKTKLVTIEEVKTTMEGNRDAEKLKNFIIQEYENYNIKYVLLGGDDDKSNQNDIPCMGFSASFKDYGTDPISDKWIAADMYYGCLDGDNFDDLEWEVYIARFAVDDDRELQRMINKTIKYSEEPVVDALKKVVLSGEELWSNINGGTIYGKVSIECLVGKCEKNNYTTYGYDDSYTFFRLYEDGGTWSSNDLISRINQGLHYIDHLGHSNNTMVMKLRTTNVSSLTNSAYYIGFTEGCYSGSFDNRGVDFNGTENSSYIQSDCIGEAFTCGTDGGAVAFISNTRFGLGDNGKASPDGSDGSSIRFERCFHDALFGANIHYLGMMMAYSKEYNKEEILETGINTPPYFGQMGYCCFEINALGDPALSIWSEAPEELEKDYTLENNKFTWDTKTPYTWIALCDNDKNILTAYLTGEDGKCNIDIDGDEALSEYLAENSYEKLIVRAKAHNYYPFEGVVDVTDIINFADNNYSILNTFIQSGKIVRLNYILPVSQFVNLSIYNLKGMLIKTLINGKQNAGKYSELVDIGDLSNGIYYSRLKTNNNHSSIKFIVTK